MSKHVSFALLILSSGLGGAAFAASSPAELEACEKLVLQGFRPLAEDRANRFTGKVTKEAALCRGGDKAVKFMDTPWVDWSNYWATADESSKAEGAEARTLFGKHLKPNG